MLVSDGSPQGFRSPMGHVCLQKGMPVSDGACRTPMKHVEVSNQACRSPIVIIFSWTLIFSVCFLIAFFLIFIWPSISIFVLRFTSSFLSHSLFCYSFLKQLLTNFISFYKNILNNLIIVQILENFTYPDGAASEEFSCGWTLAGEASCCTIRYSSWSTQPSSASYCTETVLRTLRYDLLLPEGEARREQKTSFISQGKLVFSSFLSCSF